MNIAWDGGQHAFILDTTVHPEYRRHGIGSMIVGKAVELAKNAGITWLHVDYEAYLDGFYKKCGFKDTKAGLLRLLESDGLQ